MSASQGIQQKGWSNSYKKAGEHDVRLPKLATEYALLESDFKCETQSRFWTGMETCRLQCRNDSGSRSLLVPPISRWGLDGTFDLFYLLFRSLGIA